MKKYNVDEIHLRIEEVQIHDKIDKGVMLIRWSSDIGFGEYVISGVPKITNPEKIQWLADTECMDSNDDKSFGRKLLELWLDQAWVVG